MNVKKYVLYFILKACEIDMTVTMICQLTNKRINPTSNFVKDNDVMNFTYYRVCTNDCI